MQADGSPVGRDVEDRRHRRSRRTREALAAAAVDLVLEVGLSAATVDAIAERADVSRRTFSRHFVGKEDAALYFTRADGVRINELLSARPEEEPPLVAYRGAVLEWLRDPERAAGHSRPKERAVLALVAQEPDLFSAYQRIKAEAQAESVRLLAARLGAPADDLLPLIVVETGAAILAGVLHRWAGQGTGDPAELIRDVERAYELLTTQAVATA
jgi:AcrR family transcriptional regulator